MQRFAATLRKRINTQTTGCECRMLKGRVVCLLCLMVMAMWGRSPLMVALPLWMCFGRAAASEPHVCYILDGILFLYGVVLTALLCKIKICSSRESQAVTGKPEKADDRIYVGLTTHTVDTYETIGRKK